jgi:hypothetical protein
VTCARALGSYPKGPMSVGALENDVNDHCDEGGAQPPIHYVLHAFGYETSCRRSATSDRCHALSSHRESRNHVLQRWSRTRVIKVGYETQAVLR